MPQPLNTAESLLAAAIEAEAIYNRLPQGDPARSLYKRNIEFFLNEAVDIERISNAPSA